MRTNYITLLITIGIFISIQANSQFSLSLTSGIRSTTEKVVNAYQQHFASIQGDTLSVTHEAEIFASTVKPDAESICTLTHFLQPGEALYSWEAIILRTEDFATASKKYNACCMQLKGITANTGNGRCKFDSDFEPTSASTKSFYSTLFTPNTNIAPYSNLRIEVLLESNITEWILRVLVYDNDRKDTDGNLAR